MKKKVITVISIILSIIIIISSIKLVNIISTESIERKNNVQQYGTMAEIYYDTFKFPKDKDNVDEIMYENDFILTYELYMKPLWMHDYDVYEKTKSINNKNYNFFIKIEYDIDNENIYYSVSTDYNGINFTLTKQLYENNYELDLLIIIDKTESIRINLLTGEPRFEEDKNNPLYQNYLNGDF